MPTLVELQRQQPLSKHRHLSHGGEELVADRRATLSPSQVVERKLAAHQLRDVYRPATALRPRAK